MRKNARKDLTDAPVKKSIKRSGYVIYSYLRDSVF